MGPRIASGNSGLCGLALVLALVLGLLTTGCASTTETEGLGQEPARQAVVRATERMRAIISAGQPSDQASREIAALRRELKMAPRTSVLSGLIGALREGEDEYNSVLIHLLDELDAADWVPVKFRARTMTIESAVQLVRLEARRAEQAEVYVDRVRELCSADLSALSATWIGLLESPPIYAWQKGEKVDVACYVQGLALLGLVRSEQSACLSVVLARVEHQRVTAPPAHMSQLLIHLSGKKLKQNLAQWLRGPQTARIAALVGVNLLRLRASQPTPSPTSGRVEAAAAWVERLPEGSTWQKLVCSELRALVPKASERELELGPQKAARLVRARRLLDVPGERDPIRWLSDQPVTNRLRALERLVGIDILVCCPFGLPLRN